MHLAVVHEMEHRHLGAQQHESPGTAAPSLAAVSTAGYGGLLLGPPAIGLPADAASLRSAFGLVCLPCAVAAALAARSLG